MNLEKCLTSAFHQKHKSELDSFRYSDYRLVAQIVTCHDISPGASQALPVSGARHALHIHPTL